LKKNFSNPFGKSFNKAVDDTLIKVEVSQHAKYKAEHEENIASANTISTR
jgi:hypothetical protein